jgi:hypothetical protein
MHTILCPLGGPGSCFDDVSDGGGRWWELELGSTRKNCTAPAMTNILQEFKLPKTETDLPTKLLGLFQSSLLGHI